MIVNCTIKTRAVVEAHIAGGGARGGHHRKNAKSTNPNPKVRKSGAVGKAVLVSMVLAGSIRVARGDSGEGMVNLRQRHSILTW